MGQIWFVSNTYNIVEGVNRTLHSFETAYQINKTDVQSVRSRSGYTVLDNEPLSNISDYLNVFLFCMLQS